MYKTGGLSPLARVKVGLQQTSATASNPAAYVTVHPSPRCCVKTEGPRRLLVSTIIRVSPVSSSKVYMPQYILPHTLLQHENGYMEGTLLYTFDNRDIGSFLLQSDSVGLKLDSAVLKLVFDKIPVIHQQQNRC